jgi:hypothetical protein
VVLVLEGGGTWRETFLSATFFTTNGIRTGLGPNPDLSLKPATLRLGYVLTQCNVKNYGRVRTVPAPISLGVLSRIQLHTYADFCKNQVKASHWITHVMYKLANLPRE